MPEAKSEPDQAVSTNPDEWESNLKKNWVKFTENFITIRRRDGAVEALLSRSRRSSCARTSRPSCCRPSSPSTASSRPYDDSLDKAQRWLTQYFDTDNSATHYMQSELDKLKGSRSVQLSGSLQDPGHAGRGADRAPAAHSGQQLRRAP